MTQDELNVILEKHKKWLDKEDGGERANLCDAEMSYLDLRGANLCEANMRDVNLKCSDLRGADLRQSYLQGADLRYAHLQGADLRGADLTNTKLRHSYLQCADLRVACITNTDFSDTEMLSIGNIGSRNDTTYYQPSTNMIRCGCFTGTLEAFTAKVEETHRDDQRYLNVYRAAIQVFKAMSEAGVEPDEVD